MGLLTLLLRLPFLPLQGFVRLAGVIGEEAERQLRDPARIRRELEDAQRQRTAGGMSEDDLSRIEYEATSRLVTGRPVTPHTNRTGGDRDG